jgi:4-hydroxybenzoate polyprenyltransferase
MLTTLKTLFWVSRPISWVNTAYPFAASLIMTGAALSAPLIIGTIFFLIPYNVLMYGINDVFDYESDIRNPRKGGIEGAVASRAHHPVIIWGSTLLCLPFLGYLFTLGPISAKLWLGFLIFMVLAYSAPYLRFKERPVLDSITSSIHFVGPLIYALLLVGFPGSAWPAVAAFFAWGMASHAFGAVQDIQADRAGGIASIATVFGARRTILLVTALYAAAATLVVSYGPLGILVAAAVVPYVINAWRFRRLTDATAEQANAGWRRFLWLNWVAGFVVTIALILEKLS